MIEEVWIEEDLLSPSTQEGCTKDIIPVEVPRIKCGKLLLNQIRWEKLNNPKNIMGSERSNSTYFLIRLGLQLQLTKDEQEAGSQFSYVRCESYLWATNEKSQPSVYDIFPKSIYDGEPRKIGIKLGPNFTFQDYGGSLGEIGTELVIGQITPVVVGWPGEQERTPYWELRPNTKKLLGTQHFWFVTELPNGGVSFRIAIRAEAEIQTKLGPINIRPKIFDWTSRPSVVIS